MELSRSVINALALKPVFPAMTVQLFLFNFLLFYTCLMYIIYERAGPLGVPMSKQQCNITLEEFKGLL